MRFKDNVAIVTGAASGMGLLTAQRLAEEGAKVVLTDVNKVAVEAAAEEIRKKGGDAVGVQVDVRNYGQVKDAVAFAVEKYGSVDILLNSAGGCSSRVFGRSEPFHELDIEVVDWGCDVNFKGPIYFCHAVLGQMVKQKSGVVINMGSVDGVTGSGSLDYGASKAGMIGLTKSLAICGAPYGIRACCVSPGPVLTRPAMAKMKTRLGRAAEPEEVAAAVYFMASEDASFITGQYLIVDGGYSIGVKTP